MNCGAFRSKLIELTDGSLDGPARERARGDLERHAGACRDCSGYGDLLELLALPAGERDLIEAPPRAYWADFDERLRSRIGAADGIARAPRRGRWAAAAALLLLAATAWWVGKGPSPASREMAPQERVGEDEALPAALAEVLEEVAASDALDELPFLGGLWGGWDAAPQDEVPETTLPQGWLFPVVDDLSPAERLELLEWFREQVEPNEGVTS